MKNLRKLNLGMRWGRVVWMSGGASAEGGGERKESKEGSREVKNDDLSVQREALRILDERWSEVSVDLGRGRDKIDDVGKMVDKVVEVLMNNYKGNDGGGVKEKVKERLIGSLTDVKGKLGQEMKKQSGGVDKVKLVPKLDGSVPTDLEWKFYKRVWEKGKQVEKEVVVGRQKLEVTQASIDEALRKIESAGGVETLSVNFFKLAYGGFDQVVGSLGNLVEAQSKSVLKWDDFKSKLWGFLSGKVDVVLKPWGDGKSRKGEGNPLVGLDLKNMDEVLKVWGNFLMDSGCEEVGIRGGVLVFKMKDGSESFGPFNGEKFKLSEVVKDEVKLAEAPKADGEVVFKFINEGVGKQYGELSKLPIGMERGIREVVEADLDKGGRVLFDMPFGNGKFPCLVQKIGEDYRVYLNYVQVADGSFKCNSFYSYKSKADLVYALTSGDVARLQAEVDLRDKQSWKKFGLSSKIDEFEVVKGKGREELHVELDWNGVKDCQVYAWALPGGGVEFGVDYAPGILKQYVLQRDRTFKVDSVESMIRMLNLMEKKYSPERDEANKPFDRGLQLMLDMADLNSDFWGKSGGDGLKYKYGVERVVFDGSKLIMDCSKLRDEKGNLRRLVAQPLVGDNAGRYNLMYEDGGEVNDIK